MTGGWNRGAPFKPWKPVKTKYMGVKKRGQKPEPAVRALKSWKQGRKLLQQSTNK